MVGRYMRGREPRTFPLWLSTVPSIRSKRTDSTFERFQRDEIYRAECVGRIKHTDTSVGGHYRCVREAAARGWAPTRLNIYPSTEPAFRLSSETMIENVFTMEIAEISKNS